MRRPYYLIELYLGERGALQTAGAGLLTDDAGQARSRAERLWEQGLHAAVQVVEARWDLATQAFEPTGTVVATWGALADSAIAA